MLFIQIIIVSQPYDKCYREYGQAVSTREEIVSATRTHKIVLSEKKLHKTHTKKNS